MNNHIGVPLTLLRLNGQHEIAVIEMGANKLLDIQELCDIANPTHGIITNIGKAHLGGFINFEGVLKTKTELFSAVQSSKGVLFVNEDDDVLMQAIPNNVSTVLFSKDKTTSRITGEILELNPFVSMQWKEGRYSSEPIQTHLIGAYNFYNFLAAISIGRFFDVDATLISEAIREYIPSNNRSQVYKSKNNTLILDAYNANPTSMRAALESFSSIQHDSKLAVLGDMFELGEETPSEHSAILNLLEDFNFTCIFVGKHFSAVQRVNDNFKFFESIESAKEYLISIQLQDKLILLKGSRGIGLEQLVDAL